MVALTVDTTLRVKGGQTLAMGNSVDSRTVSVAKFELAPKIGEGKDGKETIVQATNEIPLVIPIVQASIKPVLLGIRVRNRDGTPGTVDVIAKHYPAKATPVSADAVTVEGSLVVVSPDLLRLWVKDGPHAFEFKTKEKARSPITVDLVVAMGADPDPADGPGNGDGPAPPVEGPGTPEPGAPPEQ